MEVKQICENGKELVKVLRQQNVWKDWGINEFDDFAEEVRKGGVKAISDTPLFDYKNKKWVVAIENGVIKILPYELHCLNYINRKG